MNVQLAVKLGDPALRFRVEILISQLYPRALTTGDTWRARYKISITVRILSFMSAFKTSKPDSLPSSPPD